jgi:regulation of enolase protein 1 (concanavalin A-like superfamily)
VSSPSYQPSFRYRQDDGPCLFATLPNDVVATVQTDFSLNPKRQFDQAGLAVRFDSNHWIKTGIEVVDGVPRLSCVVCNVYADWSTQVWPEPRARIRVHLRGDSSFVVEAAPFTSTSDSDWAFVRICHLSPGMVHQDDPLRDHPNATSAFVGPSAPPKSVWAGVFACCPDEQAGCTATFTNFTVTRGSSFDHTADGL